MHNAIYSELTHVAKSGGVTTYGAIAPLAGLDMGNPDHRNQLAQILGDISRAEHEAGRPLLSVLVILEGENIPGKGFFTLAQDLGLYAGRTKNEDLMFFVQELDRLHKWWRAVT